VRPDRPGLPLAVLPDMRRPALLVTVILTTLASGCATAPVATPPQLCHKDRLGRCGRDDAISAALELGALALGAGIYVAATHRTRSPEAGAPAPDPALVGRVRWQDSRDGVPGVSVSLHGSDGRAVRNTTTDQAGRFRFSFPRKPDWYTVSVAREVAEGETTLWLQNRQPTDLEVLVNRRRAPAATGAWATSAREP
jgi:hypothetical protein